MPVIFHFVFDILFPEFRGQHFKKFAAAAHGVISVEDPLGWNADTNPGVYPYQAEQSRCQRPQL